MRLLGWIGLAAALLAIVSAMFSRATRRVRRMLAPDVTGPVPQWVWDEEFLPPPM